MFIERRRDASLQSQDWIARQLGKVRAGLSEAEGLLDSSASPGAFSLADIALASAIGYVEFRLDADVGLGDYPLLDSFYRNMLSRPSLAGTCPPR